MRRPLLVVITLVLALHISAAEATPGDPAAFFTERIQPLLRDNCWRCHGPVKQRAGLRLDSREAVLRGGRTTVVVPGHPENSKLIDAVGYDDLDLQMPPSGRLAEREIADLTAWVRSGVPWASVQPAAAASPPPSSAGRWWTWAGRLHPLVVHFPIALILAAAFAEVLAMRGGDADGWRRTARFCLGLGVPAAGLAVVLGWSAAAGADASRDLAWHRGLGITVAVVASAALALAPSVPHPGTRERTYRLALAWAALLLIPVGHLGGGLVHGAGWLDPPW